MDSYTTASDRTPPPKNASVRGGGMFRWWLPLILIVLAIAYAGLLVGLLPQALDAYALETSQALIRKAFIGGVVVFALLLLTGGGYLLRTVRRQERRKRLSVDMRVRQEQQVRSQIEQDYDRLLKSHRVTGKPTRAILEETLDTIDTSQTPYTLCMVRLCRFNEIEQALGYRAAEELLKSYLRQLNSYLKRRVGARLVIINGYGVASVDTINHAFALYRENETDQIQDLLCEIRAWLDDNFREGRFSFSWGPSLGVAHAPEHGADAAGILSSAGVASLSTGQRLTVYDPAIAEWQYRQQVLMLDVEHGLASNAMWLEYQPKVSIRDSKVRSVEALIRWRHPEFGLVAPDQWIPLAEQVGVIHPVTLWVIERACSEYRHLTSRYGTGVSLAVNISAVDLIHPGFEDEISDILARHGMKPEDLILEITETAMMTDPEGSGRVIHTLSRRGFRIAMDDFGTGHSSLGTLASFDLDELKIDRSFLKDILAHPTRQRIFRATLELGEALDLNVVVEGVEDEAVVCWLQQFPGLFGQGYFWGRPEPASP
ncbi:MULTISPECIES: putative bifunctional diguanylate cyclase/phosphodiesterase [Marinobacter]|uniref:putative bifunctional diguanylate cyclase/phosphodiesterase n=1 Tax=Marinobacter TaxID=2742 RepID=UPI001CDA1276|nr:MULTISPECIES: GGDEF domain-containing phosphodiesterase [Marinobacter]